MLRIGPKGAKITGHTSSEAFSPSRSWVSPSRLNTGRSRTWQVARGRKPVFPLRCVFMRHSLQDSDPPLPWSVDELSSVGETCSLKAQIFALLRVLPPQAAGRGGS